MESGRLSGKWAVHQTSQTWGLGRPRTIAIHGKDCFPKKIKGQDFLRNFREALRNA
jgi:hypothetical protein